MSEYIGEVIGHSNFVRRLRDYGEEGIKHFYFMALQKDEVRRVTDSSESRTSAHLPVHVRSTSMRQRKVA